MENLTTKYLEVFPEETQQDAESNVLTIIQSLQRCQEIEIPEGKEEEMTELISMAKNFVDGKVEAEASQQGE